MLARLEALGARVEVQGDRLRVVAPRGALAPADLEMLRARKQEVLESLRLAGDRFATLRAGQGGSTAELLGRFLADASIPLAVFHSRALGRDFILARDSAALAALTEADRRLPVLTFSECEHLAGLSVPELGALLDAKRLLGSEVTLREVRPATRTLQ
jgi:hypothetical protein